MKNEGTKRQWEESEFFTFDKEKIFFRYSRPKDPDSKKSLLILRPCPRSIKVLTCLLSSLPLRPSRSLDELG